MAWNGDDGRWRRIAENGSDGQRRSYVEHRQSRTEHRQAKAMRGIEANEPQRQWVEQNSEGGEQVSVGTIYRVRTSVYIDEKTIEIIRRQAEKENRSVSNLIEIILMGYCKKVEQSNEE